MVVGHKNGDEDEGNAGFYRISRMVPKSITLVGCSKFPGLRIPTYSGRIEVAFKYVF